MVYDYLKFRKSLVPSKDIVAYLNKELNNKYKRWENRYSKELSSASFMGHIGRHLEKDERFTKMKKLDAKTASFYWNIK